MSKQEANRGEMTPEEQKIARGIDQGVKRELENISETQHLRKSGKIGVAAVLAASVAVGAVGYNLGESSGKETGATDEAARLFPQGELNPDIEEELVEDENVVTHIQGWTAESLREFNVEVPEFPFPVLGEEVNPENSASGHSWIAVSKDGIYLPREEDDTVGDLTGDMRSANSKAGRIDKSLGYKAGELSDFLEADLASIRDTEESIFQNGHVVTAHQVEVDEVPYGIAIGRVTPDAPLSYITFDASKEAPLPEGVSAGGFIVSK